MRGEHTARPRAALEGGSASVGPCPVLLPSHSSEPKLPELWPVYRTQLIKSQWFLRVLIPASLPNLDTITCSPVLSLPVYLAVFVVAAKKRQVPLSF